MFLIGLMVGLVAGIVIAFICFGASGNKPWR